MSPSFDLAKAVARLYLSTDADTVIRVLNDEARRLTGADASAVARRSDEDEHEYSDHSRPSCYWGSFEPVDTADTWVKQCLDTDMQVYVEDAAKDSHSGWAADKPIRTLVVTPLHSSHMYGALCVYWYEPREIRPEVREMLRFLVEEAVNALANVTLVATLKEDSAKKDNFMAVLSHELRNPITPLYLAVDMLRAKVRDLEEGKGISSLVLTDLVDSMDRQTQQLAGLTSDLLDAARINTGKIRICLRAMDLKKLVREVVHDRHLAREGLHQHMQLILPDEEVHIEGDAQRLTQVLGNLLDNASKFTPKGGSITVKLVKDATDARLIVQDTGCGISESGLRVVFDPFVQEDAKSRTTLGLGLGLSVARTIMRMHKGAIQVHSDGLDQGTTFTMHFPLLQSYILSDLSHEHGVVTMSFEDQAALVPRVVHFQVDS